MLSYLPVRSKTTKSTSSKSTSRATASLGVSPPPGLTLGSVGTHLWASDTPSEGVAKQLQFLKGEQSGTACSSCNRSEDVLLPCTSCNRRYCFNKSSKVAEKRCVTYEFYRVYIRGDQPWICPHCTRRNSDTFQPGILDPAQDIRSLYHNTVSPLLIISITAAGVGTIGTENIINILAESHWMDTPSHYCMVKLETCGDVEQIREEGKRASSKIVNFLQGGNIYRTRVLIILNLHSNEEDGSIIVEARDGEFIVGEVDEILPVLLGDDVWIMLRSLNTIKGMILITSGYALAIEESRKRYESLIEKDVFSFVLGFSGKTLIERHVQDGIAEFVQAAFIEVPDNNQLRVFAKELESIAPGHLSFARCMAFSRSTAVHSHTGIILLERVGERIQSSEFRRGLPTQRPFGLPHPVCGFCGYPNNITFWPRGNSTAFRCTCGARTEGRVQKPEGILDGAPKLLGPSHFVFSFPYSTQNVQVTWRKDDSKKSTNWSGLVY